MPKIGQFTWRQFHVLISYIIFILILWAFSQYLWINFKFLLEYVMYALNDCIFGVDHFS
jgi:hypothetical protein